MTKYKDWETSALAKARRARAAEFSRQSFALEGIYRSEQQQHVMDMWVRGEISDAEFERLAGIRK